MYIKKHSYMRQTNTYIQAHNIYSTGELNRVATGAAPVHRDIYIYIYPTSLHVFTTFPPY